MLDLSHTSGEIIIKTTCVLAMDTSHIKFYKDKKYVITNILDAAVKTLEFDQKSYLRLKEQLMRIVEKPGYEGLGLAEIVTITNKMIEKVANHKGFVIVDPVAAEESPAEGEGAVSRPSGAPAGSAVSRNAVEEPAFNKQNIKGKEKLLRLVLLLPPYISSEDATYYSAQIREARLGGVSSSGPARTTADFDKLLAKQVVEVYSSEFDALVKTDPEAFMTSVEMVDGQHKKVDISNKLRNQLVKVDSIAEFLSVKDLVDRHIKGDKKAEKAEKKKYNLFFWRKS